MTAIIGAERERIRARATQKQTQGCVKTLQELIEILEKKHKVLTESEAKALRRNLPI